MAWPVHSLRNEVRNAQNQIAATIEVWLEDDRRVIRQRIAGNVDVDDFLRLERQTAELSNQLHDPAVVLVLCDARRIGTATFRARREMLRPLKRPELRRIAMYGAPPLGRLMARFMSLVLGSDKLRMFAGEEEALEWLLSLGSARPPRQ
jgi:hypothetical protein